MQHDFREEGGAEEAPSRDGVGRTPMGANFTAAYKMDIGEWGAIEPVFRASYVTTNGMGLKSAYTGDYLGNINQAMTFYGGVNWYATTAVKTSLGYEFGYYDQGDAVVERVYGNTVWAQVQVLF